MAGNSLTGAEGIELAGAGDGAMDGASCGDLRGCFFCADMGITPVLVGHAWLPPDAVVLCKASATLAHDSKVVIEE